MVRYVTSAGLLSAAVVSILSAPVKRDVATVQADITSISSQVTALDTSLANLSDSAPDLQSALNINTAASAVDTSLQKATTDAKALLAAGPISDTDSRAILGNIVGFVPSMFDALSLIVTKKATFAKLPIAVGPLVLADLNNLLTDVVPFEAALISIAPNHLQSVGQDLTVKINSAFVTAIVAYGGTATAPAPSPVITATPTPAPSGNPGATLATVGDDIASIKTQVIALDNSINSFSSTAPTLQDALLIDGAGVALDTAIQVATKDVITATTGVAVSAGEAQIIIDAVNGFKSQILDALTAIVAKKPAFALLPVSVNALVLADLLSIYNHLLAFEDALIAAAPDSLKATAQQLASSINSAFATAIAAYGGSVTPPVYTAPPSGPTTTTPAPPATTTTKPPPVTTTTQPPPVTTTTKPPPVTTTTKPPPASTTTKPPATTTTAPPSGGTCTSKCHTGNFFADLFCFLGCILTGGK